MSIVDQVLGNRRIELKQFRKDILIDRCIKLEGDIASQETKHKRGIESIEKIHDKEISMNEEYYANSNSYEYVKQILEAVTKANSEMEYYKSMFEDLQQNGYQDLTKEIQQLRSKIVRMA